MFLLDFVHFAFLFWLYNFIMANLSFAFNIFVFLLFWFFLGKNALSGEDALLLIFAFKDITELILDRLFFRLFLLQLLLLNLELLLIRGWLFLFLDLWLFNWLCFLDYFSGSFGMQILVCHFIRLFLSNWINLFRFFQLQHSLTVFFWLHKHEIELHCALSIKQNKRRRDLHFTHFLFKQNM